MNKEEFDRYAYAYRSWPSSDPAGVVARFDELTAYVDGLIVAGKLSTLRTASDKIATGEQFRHNCVINMVNEFWLDKPLHIKKGEKLLLTVLPSESENFE